MPPRLPQPSRYREPGDHLCNFDAAHLYDGHRHESLPDGHPSPAP